MRWQKLGLLYCPTGLLHPKLATHAANPLAVPLGGDFFRVFYSGRDSQNRSSVGFVDLDMKHHAIVHVQKEPVFLHGGPDSYYSHGVSVGCVYQAGGRGYMLFMSWQCPPGDHWRGDIGRLILDENLTLRADGNAPFLSTGPHDPLSLSYPWVLRDTDGGYRMWYGSTATWDGGNGEMVHVINQATSIDGHLWRRDGLAVPYQLGEAQAFSRPCVVGNPRDGYQMWFSYRRGCADKYRIGYAVSEDGRTWELKLDEVGIDVSPSGWDSEMIEYPFVFDYDDSRYMLYNGNGFGLTGFGIAILT